MRAKTLLQLRPGDPTYEQLLADLQQAARTSSGFGPQLPPR